MKKLFAQLYKKYGLKIVILWILLDMICAIAILALNYYIYK